MLRRIVSGMAFVTLVAGVVAFAFAIQLAGLELKSWIGDDRQSTDVSKLSLEAGDNWDFGNEVKRDYCAYVDDDSVELVVGLADVQSNNYSELMGLVVGTGGELVNTVEIGGEIEAVVADIPCRAVSAFASEVDVAGLARYTEPNVRFELDFVPNDPEWPRQWGPRMIEADYAWNTTMGDPSVLVAVIDSGIDWNHPDLGANYVPLGYDWVNNDANPMDDDGHGTHCAGIIGAAINNNTGIAGLAQVRIMAEKALGPRGGDSDDLANAIVHAVNQGADILSCSWGGYEESTIVYEAMKYAYNHSVLIIGSAGNGATYITHYPSDYPEVVAVTATDASDAPASFTNFGHNVEVAAPGVRVYSTLWDDSYGNKSGTSMSAPHVAGVAALIWSQFPNMTRDQVRAQLRYSADDLGYPGFDVYYGYGRINARRAVEHDLLDHDVLVSHLETMPCVELGSTALINTTVFNFGMEDETNVTIRLLVNGSLFESVVVGSLASLKSATVGFPWIPVAKGIYNITSYVALTLTENVTENNALSVHLMVRTPEILRVPRDYPTIQAAVNAAAPSAFKDTVEVEAGTYYECVTVDKSVDIIGEDRNTSIIDGNGTGIVLRISRSLITRARVYALGGVNVSRFTVRNGDCGIYLSDERCTLRSNNITENGFNLAVDGDLLPTFMHDIDSSNTVDGKPVYYWVNEHDKQIPADAGYVAIVNSTNIIVRGLELTNNLDGVLFAYTSESSIESVDVSSNPRDGIRLYYSNNNTIAGSTATGSENGIRVRYSDNNIIVDNRLLECRYGIMLTESKGNVVKENRVWNMSFFDVVLEWSYNNVIYHNNFFGDGGSYNRGSINIWDNGCEGNFWNNYPGVDSDGDGIGDTPYGIPLGDTDNFPLMNPYWNPGDINHDLIVDIYDVVLLSGAYGTTPSDTNWNPHCDITEPLGIINIYDVVLLCGSYREEYTP